MLARRCLASHPSAPLDPQTRTVAVPHYWVNLGAAGPQQRTLPPKELDLTLSFTWEIHLKVATHQAPLLIKWAPAPAPAPPPAPTSPPVSASSPFSPPPVHTPDPAATDGTATEPPPSTAFFLPAHDFAALIPPTDDMPHRAPLPPAYSGTADPNVITAFFNALDYHFETNLATPPPRLAEVLDGGDIVVGSRGAYEEWRKKAGEDGDPPLHTAADLALIVEEARAAWVLSDAEKKATTNGLMAGRAQMWALANRGAPTYTAQSYFLSATDHQELAQKWSTITQGKHSFDQWLHDLTDLKAKRGGRVPKTTAVEKLITCTDP
ncbi:hypothetical protein BDK51DRAFT_40613 [Blyttiomyces helicus]|uniref:Uncharacterized protein n=1 Tax=Blyttiomyces helicus TaxID=388810 RepID=A0A4P9WNM3_9FUNG|nr:hypothetical protein BDK51DRAFT_40613 [Blyttiomyces helicus]|eukprot:RKO94731.1 hypothetical protein BDK51DRAFT_40613 [Blyttiomyces helicus]